MLRLLLVLATPPDVSERPSYLFQFQKDNLVGRRYRPQPGDLLLLDDHHEIAATLYHICGTGKPLHSAIVFHREDGTPAVLEAGRNGVLKVFVTDAETRMHSFDGTILVRRLRTPLSAREGACTVRVRECAGWQAVRVDPVRSCTPRRCGRAIRGY